MKDIKIARSVLDEMGVESRLPNLMIALMEEALRIAGPNADHTQVIKGWEKRLGLQLKKSKL